MRGDSRTRQARHRVMAILDAFRFADSNVCVSNEHVRVNITVDCSVGAENGLELGVDEEVI